MRMCMDHWSKLRAAIADRGIEHLVARSGAALVARVMDDEAGKPGFDPLFFAHNQIVGNAMSLVGLSLMAPNEDGSERCPLCYLQSLHEATCSEADCKWTYEQTWIPGAAGEAFTEAVRHGLVASDSRPV